MRTERQVVAIFVAILHMWRFSSMGRSSRPACREGEQDHRDPAVTVRARQLLLGKVIGIVSLA